jgi:branched-chain amino acid transport system substrate-binding protein
LAVSLLKGGSAKEAGDRNAERRSLAEGARKPREIKTRYGKTGLNEEDN